MTQTALPSIIDVTLLQKDRPGRAAKTKLVKEPKHVWTPEELVKAAVGDSPKPRELILARAVTSGMSDREAARMLLVAEDRGLIFKHPSPDPADYRKAYYASTEPTLLSASRKSLSARAAPHTPRVRARTGGGGTARTRKGEK